MDALFNGSSIPLTENGRDSVFALILTVYTVTAVVIGTLGNLLTIYLFNTVRALRTPANLLVVSLAVSDLFILVFSIPVVCSRLKFPEVFEESDLFCKITFYLLAPFNTISVNHLQLIAFNRYMIITQPRQQYNKYFSKRRTLIMIFCIWIFAIIYNSLPLFGFGGVVNTLEIGGCALDRTNKYSLWFLSILLLNIVESCGIVSPLFFILALMKIRATKRRLHDIQSNQVAARRNGGFSEEEIAVTRMVFAMFVCFVFTYSPYLIMHTLSGDMHTSALLTAWFLVIAFSNSMLNPFIYAAMNTKFRQGFRNLLPRSRAVVATMHDVVA